MSLSIVRDTSAITDVAGIKVGHFADTRRPTGCTVILAEAGAVAGVDVRGGGPGTRETDALVPTGLIEKVDAVLLSGGSAFGLDAAGGVMRWLEEHGFGHPIGPVRVPIVPAAILFDLAVGDYRVRPDAAAGYQACDAANSRPPAEGSTGAGAGACVGKLFGMARAMRGGIGTASLRVAGVTVGAIVAVNAVGDVIDPSTGRILAGARTEDGRRLKGTTQAILGGEMPVPMPIGMATTIGVVATDAVLTKAAAHKVAQMAHDGLARTIDPIHTMSDGDTIFALASGRSSIAGNPMLIGMAAAAVVAAAVLRAVTRATGLKGPGLPELPSWRDLDPLIAPGEPEPGSDA